MEFVKNIKIAVLVGALLLVGLILSALVDVSVRPSRIAVELARIFSEEEVGEDVDDISYVSLASQVVPGTGIAVGARWGDMGKKLVNTGAIDLAKFEERYGGLNEDQMNILQGDNVGEIVFRQDNIGFWTNVLWALGLTQKSKVLDEGPMVTKAEEVPVENYASTSGWTLGTKEAMQLYSSERFVELTGEEEDLVNKVAGNIFRPCCGNSTAYPDCNHGMAVLGLLELMAAQGATEEEMYEASLAFNSYAFESTYINIAAHFDQEGVSWNSVDPAEVLSAGFSSGSGAAEIAQRVGDIPGAPKRGASCGA